MKRFEEIKKKFEGSNKYMLTIGYEEVEDLIYLVDVLGKRNKQCMNSLYGFYATDYISKARIRHIIRQLELEQDKNKEFLYHAIDLLNKSEIDRYTNKMSVNWSVREYLMKLCESEVKKHV